MTGIVKEENVVICNLTAYMEEKDITLTKLAEELKITQNTVRTYMKNRFSRIDCDIAVKMCKFFNCSFGDMFEISKNA